MRLATYSSCALSLFALLSPFEAFGAPSPSRPEAAIQAQGEIPANQLLDVVIQLFDPGTSGVDPKALEEEGTYEDLRDAEAMYFAVRLMETLQSTGQWGAVRVVPRGAQSADVVVRGWILESNGKDLKLKISAVDSSGKPWLESTYKEPADRRAYSDEDGAVLPAPFQNLYNGIANDLLKARQKLKPARLEALPAITKLRFAADLVPSFEDHLKVDRRGRYKIERLPAAEDPILARVLEIREREYLLVDTLTDHYSDFYTRMQGSYANWRALSFEEQVALQEIRRKARTMKILGVLSIIGGVVAAREGEGGGGVTDLAVLGGIYAIRAGMGKTQEAALHREALKELASSLEAELDPLIFEVEGQTLRLTGSAETQYATWRSLLQKIFSNETGMPLETEAPPEPATVTDAEALQP